MRQELLNYIKFYKALPGRFAKMLKRYFRQKCPICGYSFDMCQCLYGGSAHPDRSQETAAVKDHLYLLTHKQLKHIMWLEKYQNCSSTNEKYEAKVKELGGRRQKRIEIEEE